MGKIRFILLRWMGIRYMMAMLSAVAFPLITINVINTFMSLQDRIPVQYLEAFKVGDSYNIGVLAIRSLDQLGILTLDDFARSVLSGTIMQCIIVLTLISSVHADAVSGYIKLAIVKGTKREKIFINYIVTSVVAALPIMIVSVVSTMIVCSVKGYDRISDLSQVLTVIIAQAVMILCLALCAVSVALLFPNYKMIFLVMTLIITIPTAIQYVFIFSGGNLKLDRAIITCNLIESCTMTPDQLLFGAGVAILSLIIFFAAGLLLFRRKDY